MNREIKFRAWDPTEKFMFQNIVIGASGKLVAVEYMYSADEIDLTYYTTTNGENERAFIPMQYTGLKDKNGKDIYEGDILKTPTAVWKDIFNYTYVQYRSDIASYVKRGEDNRGYVRLEIRVEQVEIIGNIYENPELLQL
jgi:uncharacterized phage protein (TIGR01671 family)